MPQEGTGPTHIVFFLDPHDSTRKDVGGNQGVCDLDTRHFKNEKVWKVWI